MPRIRCIEIDNFKSIKRLEWFPSNGINCLLGPGDSGKSTILEAIDLCLGARRNVQFSDDDFHKLDVENPIKIAITVGDLDENFKNFELYGTYLRGFDSGLDIISDEPEIGYETVITVQLKVGADLEPSWHLFSERAEAQGHLKMLSWADKLRLAPAKIGTFANYDLSWKKGSILHRLSEERADASSVLAKVGRDARSAFGDEANGQLEESRRIAHEVAVELGISVGNSVNALLASDSISFSGGTISLHSEHGIPLKNLGVGSTRLLIAGLQRKCVDKSASVLIDELEHGLEPHRIIRLLASLGTKEEIAPLQVFLTTHSPVVVRELAASQLHVVRNRVSEHKIVSIGMHSEIQGTIRTFPDAFLAPLVVVCEGATEVGLIRGVDHYRSSRGETSIFAKGVALVDAGGVDKILSRAFAFQAIGCKTAILRDDDVQPDAQQEESFKKQGGIIFRWENGRATEDELFENLSDNAVQMLIKKACLFHGSDEIDEHIKSASLGKCDLGKCRNEFKSDFRPILAKASKGKKSAWFKSVSFMEKVAQEVIGPDRELKPSTSMVLNGIFKWIFDVKN